MSRPDLTIAGAARPERADAARNRRRILEAAERLFAEQGIEKVSMDAVAEAAGVGKGTLYRRFGDRAGLALALLDARERDLQEAIVRGRPPLGPGAPPATRLVAFLRALLDLVERHTDIILTSETASVGARYRSRTYASWRAHTVLLLRAARPEADAELAADLLLAPLAADLYRHLRRERGLSAKRIGAGVETLAQAVLSGSARTTSSAP